MRSILCVLLLTGCLRDPNLKDCDALPPNAVGCVDFGGADAAVDGGADVEPGDARPADAAKGGGDDAGPPVDAEPADTDPGGDG